MVRISVINKVKADGKLIFKQSSYPYIPLCQELRIFQLTAIYAIISTWALVHSRLENCVYISAIQCFETGQNHTIIIQS